MHDTCENSGKLFGQQGFTLLEVLIALLVLSIGLLGLAALQTVGLKSNQMAAMRTQATQSAYDITDRMRSNPQGVIDGDYDVDNGTHAAAATDCQAALCDDASLAAYDLDEWKKSIGLLPGGLGEIKKIADTPLTYEIIVRWDESRLGVNGVNCPPETKDDLRCFRMVVSE